MSKICGFETYKVDGDVLSIRDTQTPRGVPSETSRVVVCYTVCCSEVVRGTHQDAVMD